MSGLPDRFPRGWFVLGHQRDFPIGEEKIIYGFNQKILVEGYAGVPPSDPKLVAKSEDSEKEEADVGEDNQNKEETL